jgi:2-oxo-hept-3-ene-1,7-dioate hydratase
VARTLDEAAVQRIAAELEAAEQNRRPRRQLRREFPDLDIDDSYAIQAAWMAHKAAAGRRLLGRKIGLTSRAMQQAFGIAEPDYGTLLDDMFFADGALIPGDRFIVPMVEVELAFVLGAPLAGETVSITDVLRATEYVQPAIEIIDARTERVDAETGQRRGVLDTIADNAASAGVVLGGRPVRPQDIDLRWAGAVLYCNGVIEETGLAAGVLGHPAAGIAWLARRFARHGVALEAGQVILAGSFTRALPVTPGDVFHADYGRLGSFGFSFGASG